MNPPLLHLMILANAGSGKTYRLVSRMAEILLRGAAPRSLAALTFTRKAAGEFQTEIFLRLANACLESMHWEALRRDANLPDLSQEECKAALARLVEEMRVLTLGTIDSLGLRILQSFALEAGLPPEVEIADGARHARLQQEVLERVLAAQTENNFEDFLELVRVQSHARAGRRIFDELLHVAEELLEIFAQTPWGVTWGDNIPDAKDPKAPHLVSLCEELKKAAWQSSPSLSQSAQEKLTRTLAQVAALRPGDVWDTEVWSFFKTKLVSNPKDGFLRIEKTREGWVKITPEVDSARQELAKGLTALALENCRARSRALHALMKSFHAERLAVLREKGCVSYADVPLMLAALAGQLRWHDNVAQRLDARFDHWMLDEFQDTSRVQWTSLAPLIDEVVQDTSGQRSFFYVGDIKQAIYGWRGGDARLFFEIRDRYNAYCQVIQTEHLAVSHRSVPAVLQGVNFLFECAKRLQQVFDLTKPATETWRQSWKNHKSAAALQQKEGFFAWEAFDAEGEGAEAGDMKILELLRRWEPWRRGLSCACLKAKNDDAAALAALLESHGIPVSLEGKTNPCTDNPVGQSLLLALRTAACPRDVFAETLLGGYPLGKTLLARGAEAFRRSALESIAKRGFSATMAEWLDGADPRPTGFQAARARDVLEAVAEFERKRGAAEGLLELLDFLTTREEAVPSAEASVRVMTVHQSKGLTFDAVIVSGLDSSHARQRMPLVLGPSDDRPEWGLLLPKKDICEAVTMLKERRELMEMEEKLGEISKAYVALTRARYACVIVAAKTNETSQAKHFGRLLTVASAGRTLRFGNADWFQNFPIQEPHPQETPPASPPQASLCLSPTPQPRRPSQSAAGRAEQRRLGKEIHGMLAAIEWGVPAQLPPSLSAEAQQILTEFFSSSHVSAIFQKPQGECRLYREVAFEDCGPGGEWVSGVIDRLVVYFDEGQPSSAQLWEFKTSSKPSEAHRAQLDAYRQHAAKVLGIPVEKVQAELVYLRMRS